MKCLITPTRLIYSNNGYNIIACDVLNPPDGMTLNKYGNITVSGEMNLKLGVQIEADLEEDTKSKYPASYKINLFNDDYDGERQLTQEEQYAILLQVTTQKQAQYIMDGCPNYVDLILHNKENEIDLKKIYNVKAAKHAVYTREIKSQFNFIMLKAKLQRWNFTDEELHKLSKLGDAKEITNIITEKPYEVYCEILERKFDNIDQFILSQLPQFETSAHRCEYCVLDILDTVESNGSTRLYANSLFQFIPSELTSLVKPTVIESEKIHYDEDTKFITKESTYQREKFVASKLKNIIKNNRNLGIDTRGYESIYLDDSHEKSLNLTDEQAKILTLVNECSVCMLNGSAGTGKSASTKAIVNMLQDNGYSVRLLAPTGVAAKVASRYTGLHGSTIHMACFGEPHIFPEDVIIVDEISMVSLDTMYMLCECLSDNHRLIFIGDPAQLCSISMGNVLTDLIESNAIPTVTLTKVFRYGIGGIATVATNVRNGERYVDDDGKLLFGMSDVDYKFIPINKEPLNQIATEYALLLEKYHYSDILILSPFNKSSFGTRAINSYIQNKYNPLNGRKQLSYKVAGEDVFFRENDLVINTKNNYDAKVAYSDFESCFIANGDIGKIVEINEDNNLIVQFDGNRLVEFNQLEMRKLLLGYAISVHRSQGCQAKAVMVITHPSHKRMLTRNLLYVACSRAQEYLVEIGDGETIGEAINVEETSERETNLREFLMED